MVNRQSCNHAHISFKIKRKEIIKLQEISLKTLLFLLVENMDKVPYQNLKLKDGDGNYHEVNSIDLLYDRICCEDGYYDYYEYLLDGNKIFIEY